MDVTEHTIKALEEAQKERLEAEVVGILAGRLGLEPAEAMDLYYSSALSRQIGEGVFGIQNLAAPYLAEDLLLNEKELLEERGLLG